MDDELFIPAKTDGFSTESPIRAFADFKVCGKIAIGKGFRPSLGHLAEYLGAMIEKEGWHIVQVLTGPGDPTMIFHSYIDRDKEKRANDIAEQNGTRPSARDHMAAWLKSGYPADEAFSLLKKRDSTYQHNVQLGENNPVSITFTTPTGNFTFEPGVINKALANDDALAATIIDTALGLSRPTSHGFWSNFQEGFKAYHQHTNTPLKEILLTRGERGNIQIHLPPEGTSYMRGAVTKKAEEVTSGGGFRNNYYLCDVKYPRRPATQERYVAECEDIIENLHMTFDEACEFKAIWRTAAARLGEKKPGHDPVYDAEKRVHYANNSLNTEKQKRDD